MADELLANATALIFPSLWYETFGMVIIEAFASGTPVVASKLGQLNFTITDKYNGLHFEAGNADDLKNKLLYYQKLPIAEKNIYQNNALKSYADNYQPEKNLTQLIAIYSTVIQNK